MHKKDESSGKIKLNNKNNNNNNKKFVSFKKNNKKNEILYKRVMTNKTTNKTKFLENTGNLATNVVKRNPSLIKDRSSTPMDVDIYSNIEKEETPKEERVDKINNDVEENIMPTFDPFKETKLSFLEFAYNYIFFCKKKDNSIEAYENFRMKIISEENMIQNYLDIHTLNKTVQQLAKDEDGRKLIIFEK